MNKTVKGILIAVVSLVIGFGIYFIYAAVEYSHTLVLHTKAKEYQWLFNYKARPYLDSTVDFSYVQKYDTYNHYIYNDNYYVTIWEFKRLNAINIQKILINYDANMQDVKFRQGEILNTHYSPEITIKYGFDFNNKMLISIDRESKIDSNFQSDHFKGFYGKINKMVLRDGNGELMILFNYSNDVQYGLFIFYKAHQSFYLLIINSDYPFDSKKLIKIFNLT